MSTSISRRGFLGNITLATTGMALLSSSVVRALTHDNEASVGYNPYSSTNADMRQSLIGSHVSVFGTVFNTDGTSVVPDAIIEVWHLSPNSDQYQHRAKLFSDEHGNYEFITDMPNKSNGNMSHIYFKISSGENSYVSKLWMNDHSAYISSDHWERNQHLGKSLLPKKQSDLLYDKINFNFSI